MDVRARARRMRPFLALLEKSNGQEVVQPRLLTLAERLCQGLQDSPQGLRKLVEAIGRHRHRAQFLTCLPVVRATVLALLCKKQYEAACKLLENCPVVEKEELLKLWNEIHYRQAMEKRHAQSLTAVQKYRCRKRNPPPASLHPGEARKRNYPQEVREILQRFAAEVTPQPSKAQRESLSRETNLKPHHVYNWFANFRRRPSRKLKREESHLPLGTADPTTCPRELLEDQAGQDRPGPGRLPKGEPEEAEDPIPTSEAGFSLPPWKPSRVPWTRPTTAHKGVQCALWIEAASCRCCCSCSGGSLRMEEGGAAAGAGALHSGPSLPRTFGELADIEMERLVESKRLLPRPSRAALALKPASSSSSELAKSQCRPVNSRSCPEGSRVLASEQGLCDPPSGDLSATDPLWAASWLCEFSLGSRL